MYSTIICAIDLSDESHRVVELAIVQAHGETERIHLVHACEHPITGYGESTGRNHQVTECQIRQEVYPRLKTIAEQHQIEHDNIHIPFGKPADAIHALCTELEGDLIVVGSHGHSGLRLLLGSTANSVIHGASCDVLTVRIRQD
ncbi:universal stress protein [Maricurvus nonylphenolicus]|uniref:universal stress protein n=1 Tax=Maricurvus nonylphenolicus TaxID=1008307 RepID=UPI0036F257AC